MGENAPQSSSSLFMYFQDVNTVENVIKTMSICFVSIPLSRLMRYESVTHVFVDI